MVDNVPVLSLRLRPSELVKYGESGPAKSLFAGLGITEEEQNGILSESNLEANSEIVIKKEITASEAITVKTSGLKSVYVAEDTKRVFTEEFFPLVGYVVSRREETEEKDLTSVDVVGKTNIEAIYDSALRGVNGQTVEYRNVKGELLEPTPSVIRSLETI
jgi:cell division protein FtsI/penicillin-binding protein 2